MRSRIPRGRTPHRVSILRMEDRDQRTLGRVVATCEPLMLYENMPARITNLREFTENVNTPMNLGSDSANVYRASLFPLNLPKMLQKGDMIRIPWNTKPNFYQNPRATLGPQLWISTPAGNVLLTWDNDKDEYNEDPDLRVYRLYYDATEFRWKFIGPSLTYDFNNTPTCGVNAVWPSGYDFVKVTGPPIDYEVLRYQHQEDDHGRYHHTRVEIEAVDHDTRKGQ